MYPGTIVNWYDQSELSQTTTTDSVDNKSLFMVVSSFDKGPEDLMEVEGTDFAKLFGKMYFSKHGQNAIQAQNIIDAGGRLLVKRVCATDATIANVILCAKVTTTETQKTNENGEPLYVSESGDETTEVTENPVMISNTTIKWEASHIDNSCKTFDEVKEKALEMLNEEEGVYPLFVYTDNGRGVSGKAVRLIPDYSTSKGIGKMFYTLTVYEGTSEIEQQTITFDPDVIYSNQAYGLEKHLCTQIQGEVLSSVYDAFISKLAKAVPFASTADARANDLVFGYTCKGASIEGLTVDAESVDLNSLYGIELTGGSNGAFGDKPVGTEAWTEAIRAVYAGEVTDEIWDVDQHKLAAVVDANLPQVVKDAIAKFVTFRQDCVFIRDLGVGNDTFLKIKEAYTRNEIRNKFIADYATSYQIKDPITKRNIEVTMLYDFAACMVNHMNSGPYNPLAGVINSFILKNAIKGTVNYTPIVTPSVNQKQAMDDLHINYAIFEDDNCVVQSCYTSQEEQTQLMYLNNTMAIQQVIRAVRTACPKSRYSLSDGSDFTKYAKDVSTVLTNFSSNFDVLQFDYTQDKLKASQKIFYASIKFAFKNWGQTEIFDVYAINND